MSPNAGLSAQKPCCGGPHQPFALIALEVGFADQGHQNSVFRREIGVTSGRFRAEMA